MSNSGNTQKDLPLSFQQRQEQFLRFVFYGGCLLALPGLITSLAGNTSFLLQGAYLGAYVILLAVTFSKLPYRFKAAALILIIYGFGISSLLKTGIWGDAQIILLTFIIMSVLLFPLSVGIVAELVSFISIGVVGWLSITHQLQLIDSRNGQPGNWIDWVSGISPLLIISILIVVALNLAKKEASEALNAIENARELRAKESVSAQEMVEERTSDLNHRMAQLESALFVTRNAAEFYDLEHLLDYVTQQITTRFGYYHGGIFLADAAGQVLTLTTTSSERGKRMLIYGHKLAIDRQSVIGFAADQKRPRIAQDVGVDAVLFNNPDFPDTHSQVALPLIAQSRLIGVLDIQSTEHSAFPPDVVYILQSMTDQIALTIENVRQLEESRSAIQDLEMGTTQAAATAWKNRLSGKTQGFTYTSLGISPIYHHQDAPAIATSEKTIKVELNLRGNQIGKIVLKRKASETAWSEAEKEMIERIAMQTVLAIDNARVLEESQRRAMREEAVSDFSNRFSHSLDIDTLLQSAVRELHRLPQVSDVSIFISPSDENKSAE